MLLLWAKSQLFFELTPADTFLLFKELYDISNEEYKKTWITLSNYLRYLTI